MKRNIIGIVSFLIIWNVFYSLFSRIYIPSLLGFVILLIAFPIILVLSKKCTDYFLQEKNINLTKSYLVIILILVLGTIGYQAFRYLPKSFEDLLHFKSEEIVAIHYSYGTEKTQVVTDREIIENVVHYLDGFTYHLMQEPGISSYIFESNSYRLNGLCFIGPKSKPVNMDFCGYEMYSLSDFYSIKGGIVEESTLLQLLQGE